MQNIADDVQQAFELFTAIGNTSSRNDKEAILGNGARNQVFKDLLVATYDPYQTYNIKKQPRVPVEGTTISSVKYSMFIGLLLDLAARRTTGNAALDRVKNFFTMCTELEARWYWAVMRKDLKIGITEGTINKVFPGLVPTFSCMLAHPMKDGKMPKRAVATRKLDGYRDLAFRFPDGRVEMRTRNGNLIEGYDLIEQALADLPSGVYDGEIMARSGSFSDTQKDVFKKGKKNKDGVYHIFDYITLGEWENQKGTFTLQQRYLLLVNMEDSIASSPHLERVVPHYLSTDPAKAAIEMMELHQQFTSEGYEGTMIGDLDAVYQFKRTYSLQKVKDVQIDDMAIQLDLPIIEVLEGNPGTKYEDMMGKLVVEMDHEDILNQVAEKHHPKVLKAGVYQVKVGSGFDDKQRADLWKRRNEIIGKTIQVRCQEVTTNDDGGHSLRFPTFEMFRHDK